MNDDEMKIERLKRAVEARRTDYESARQRPLKREPGGTSYGRFMLGMMLDEFHGAEAALAKATKTKAA